MLALGFLMSILIEPQFISLQQAITTSFSHEEAFWQLESEPIPRSFLSSMLDTLQIVLYLAALCESSLLHTYVQLCHEDYNWWWNSLLVGASPALFLLVDSTLRLLFS
jgi:Endomembrane protein 70